ncbi:MAG: Uma2 family endonuclease [Treponema sp.]|nr:Uma2 family endonuclease [Treponema sp.]
MPNTARMIVAQEDQRFTYKDYVAWELAPGERFELIDGNAYAMAAPGLKHQGIVTALGAQFYTFLQGKPWKVYVAPLDVRLFYEEDESDDTVVQPDLTVICDEQKRGEEGCRGAPDLVVEVLSPSNTTLEMERKLALYEEAGVREYWVVDPKNKDTCAYRLSDGQFGMQRYREGVITSTVLPGLEIALASVFEG